MFSRGMKLKYWKNPKDMTRAGLLLEFVGTLLTVFAFGSPLSKAEQNGVNLVLFRHPEWFYTGIVFLVLGFFLILFATFIQDDK